MKGIVVYDVVKKLVGEIEPIGETYTDNERFDNLIEMEILVDKLIFDIGIVRMRKDNHQASLKKAGREAARFLKLLGIEE